MRKTQLRYQHYGPQFYDEVEKRELLDVLESKYPFRWWGANSKVLQFERAYADHMAHYLGVRSAAGSTISSGLTPPSTRPTPARARRAPAARRCAPHDPRPACH